MAGGQERVLRRRIRSIEATKKITRSFELIAASRGYPRAQGRIAGSRPYVRAIADILAGTAAESGQATRLLGIPESPQNVLALVIVADRGLAGAYNSMLLHVGERLIRSGVGRGENYRVMAIGKKAQAYFRFRHQPVERQFVGMSDRPSFEDARRSRRQSCRCSSAVSSTWYRSSRRACVRRAASLSRRANSCPWFQASKCLSRIRARQPALAMLTAPAGHKARLGFFEFEPDAETLLSALIPQYSEAAIYGALLEASASEHTSRQRAMSAATENAEELLKTLRRVMNRARQDTITTEIMEIVGGSEALHAAGALPHDLTYPQATEEQTV